jgi:hypothetical protein
MNVVPAAAYTSTRTEATRLVIRLDVDESWLEGSDGRLLCRLEELEFHVEDTIDPYLVEESPRASSALRERLGGHRDG